MAMNRRNFLRVAALAILATPLWRIRQAAPRVYVEAARPRRYAGPIKRGDMTSIRKPGRWAG